MKDIRKNIIIIWTLLLVGSCFSILSAQDDIQLINAPTSVSVSDDLGKTSTPSDDKRLRVITNMVKSTLELSHYNKMKLTKEQNDKIFGQYLKRIDSGKELLLESDIKKLEKFKNTINEDLLNGKMTLAVEGDKIIKARVKLLNTYRQQYFATNFTFEEKEAVELDSEKRKVLKTEAELKAHWQKMFKYSTLVKYISLLDEENGTDESQKDAKKVKEKKKGPPTPPAELLKKAREDVSQKYEKLFARFLKENQDDVLEIFLNAVTTIYDPHTNYMAPKRKEDFDIDITGKLEGIGAVLKEDGQFIKVDKVITGGPAWRQKELEQEDIILMVAQGPGEFLDIVGMRVDEAVRFIRGKQGTEVRLMIKKKDGARKTISIIRDIIEIEESYAKSAVIENKELNVKIGYIYVPKFYRDFQDSTARNCTDDVRKAVKRLNALGIGGIILDFRDDGGGSLSDARDMAGLFIKEGPIVQVRNQNNQVEILSDEDPSIAYTGPMIVMVNRFSASASEIVAGALQDYKRAVIVGTQYSHGKGTVQAVVNLNQGPLLSIFNGTLGAMKLTIQKFYRVTGASTQFKGITSDILLPDPYAFAKNREMDIDFALPWDEIKGLPFVAWNPKWDLATLQKRSTERLARDKRNQKLLQYIDYVAKKRDETSVPLNLADFQKQEEESKKLAKEYKLDEKNKKIVVSSIAHESNLKIKRGDEAKWQKDLKEKENDWIELLQKDSGLEEATRVMNDMIKMEKGKPL